MRTEKKSGDTTIEYYYIGNLLIAQFDGTDWLKFSYSADGELIGFNYKGKPHYYIKNQQGDVIALCDMIAQVEARYTYDAWGKIVSVTDANGEEITDPTSVALVNPIRYRGYYYDDESGLYYLNSRYYNPEWGRFICADNTNFVTVNPFHLTDKSLYSYCDNNPIMYKDSSGHMGIIATMVVGGLISGGLTYVADVATNYVEGGLSKETFKPRSTCGDYVASVVSGMIPGVGLKQTAARVVVELSTKYLTDYYIDKTKPTIKSVAYDVSFSLLGEGINASSLAIIDYIRPNTYSSFKHSLTKIFPNITTNQAKSFMQFVNNTLTVTKHVAEIVYDLLLGVCENKVVS